jgi:uncharacterized membrane protein YfcA
VLTLPVWEQVLLFAGVGVIAQLIDGSLGMAYGVSSNSLLMALGLQPKIATSCVKYAETGTTLVSGISHLAFKNVDKRLFLGLVFTGAASGVVGAYLLTEFPGDYVKPVVSLYLLVMAVRILLKVRNGRRVAETEKEARHFSNPVLAVLGAIGGFFDAIGGGGWGPIVTTTLVGGGHEPRYAIGSVNTAEFFVTVAQAVTFVSIVGFTEFWPVIVGLLGGGVIAAPFAAWVCKKVPPKVMLILVGCLIFITSSYSLWKGLDKLFSG